MKRLCYFHNKDMDGYFSGAVVKHKYPDVELRGWDYKDPVPNIEELKNYDEVILIDITFPIKIMIEIGRRQKLTVIDHHISFKRQVDEWIDGVQVYANGELTYDRATLPFEYIFDDKLSACELGMKHYFGYIPPIVELVGKYDTWRANGTDEWETSVLPMKYFLYGIVNKPEKVSIDWFMETNPKEEIMIHNMINQGKGIMLYEKTMDESKTRNYAFEKEVFGGLRALCMNTNFFSSETMITKFDSSKYDLMIGFAFNGSNWGVSLRSVEGGADVSVIARERGGGGHRGAAGFEVKDFDSIFK